MCVIIIYLCKLSVNTYIQLHYKSIVFIILHVYAMFMLWVDSTFLKQDLRWSNCAHVIPNNRSTPNSLANGRHTKTHGLGFWVLVYYRSWKGLKGLLKHCGVILHGSGSLLYDIFDGMGTTTFLNLIRLSKCLFSEVDKSWENLLVVRWIYDLRIWLKFCKLGDHRSWTNGS